MKEILSSTHNSNRRNMRLQTCVWYNCLCLCCYQFSGLSLLHSCWPPCLCRESVQTVFFKRKRSILYCVCQGMWYDNAVLSSHVHTQLLSDDAGGSNLLESVSLHIKKKSYQFNHIYHSGTHVCNYDRHVTNKGFKSWAVSVWVMLCWISWISSVCSLHPWPQGSSKPYFWEYCHCF